jgi:LysM repeat protein
VEEEKLSLDEIMYYVDMSELKKYNPKLHDQIQSNPQQLLEL